MGQTAPTKKLLYFGPSGIGDWCFIWPSLPGLLNRFGCDSIDVILPYENAGNRLLRNTPLIDQVNYLHRPEGWLEAFSYLPRILSLVRTISRSPKYSALAISSLSNQVDFLLLSIASGIPTRIGLPTKKNFLQKRAINEIVSVSKESDKVSIHSAYAGSNVDSPVDMFEKAFVEECQRDSEYTTTQSEFISFGIGGGRKSDWRFWPAENYAELINLLPNENFLLLGGGAEDAYQADIILANLQSSNVLNLVNQVTMEQSLGLLVRSKFVVGNDSGLTNLAAVLGVKTYCLYGPTNPEITGSALLGAKAINVDVPCGPCFKADQNPVNAIICHHRRCMRELTPQMVAQAIEKDSSVIKF